MDEPTPSPGRLPSSGTRTAVLGDYRLIRRLGQGAMGQVYKARQISLDRDVAVKVLHRHMTTRRDIVQRFVREARLLARLNHPHIVPCYGVGKALGRYFMAMEYIDGRTALQWLLHLGKYRVGDALLVGLACARGLEHAHAHGMIHRDIKPDNVLLGKDGAIKLGDLGLARCLADELAITQTGMGTGTPLYMAPEQGRNGHCVDHRSDLYGLGCTLYQLLTGCLPFPGETLLEIVLAKMKGRYTPARQLNPEVPPRLDCILARLLAPFPEDRYPSCAGLIADLTALGLAHPQLSFARMSATTQHAIAPPTLPEVQTEPPCRWYVIYRNASGCWVSRPMTTPEVCDAVRDDDDFALTAQASRTVQGEYRSLEVFEAFRAAYRARRKKARVERQVADLAAQVEELTAVERRRSRWAWLWRLFRLGE